MSYYFKGSTDLTRQEKREDIQMYILLYSPTHAVTSFSIQLDSIFLLPFLNDFPVNALESNHNSFPEPFFLILFKVVCITSEI